VFLLTIISGSGKKGPPMRVDSVLAIALMTAAPESEITQGVTTSVQNDLAVNY
jgi:hypothetical protein